MRCKLKQATALILSMLLTVSAVPIESFAIQDSASGGDGSGSVSWGSDWGNDPGRSGIRISLVDVNNPSHVVSIDKSGQPKVVDIIFGSEAQFNQHAYSHGRTPTVFTGVKTQVMTKEYSSQNPNKIERIYLEDYLNYLRSIRSTDTMFGNLGGAELLAGKTVPGSEKNIPYAGIAAIRWLWNIPGKTTYTLHGKELRDWLVSNNDGVISNTVGDIESILVDQSTLMPDGQKKTVPKADSSSKRSNGATTKWINSNISTQVIQVVIQVEREIGNRNYNALLDYIEKGRRFASDATKTASKEYLSRLDTSRARWYKDTFSLLAACLKSKYITVSEYTELAKRIQNIDRGARLSINQATRKLNKDKQMSGTPNKLTKNESQGILAKVYDFIFNPITAYAAEPENPVGETEGNTEENKEKPDTTLLNHLSYILQFRDESGDPFFITQDMLDENGNIKTVTENGVERPMNIFDPLKGEHTVDYKVLVEPVDFFTPYHMDGKTPIIPVRFYGTLTNIVQAFEVYGVNANFLEGGWEDHVNRRTFNRLSWYAMTVGDNTEDLESMFNGNYIFDNVSKQFEVNVGGKTHSYRAGEDIVPNAALYASSLPYTGADGKTHQSGWGVQVYWPEAPEPADDLTSTWDAINYPDGDPGPSPEIPETELNKYTKKIKVAKWYYLYDELNNTETVFDVKLQEQSATPISIVNEGNEEGIYWKLDAWSTGVEDKVPAEDDLSTTFEEYSESNKGTYAGTEPKQLTIEATEPDTVLYVKLVQHTLPTTKVDIVKVFDKPYGTEPDIKVEKGVEIPSTGYDATDPNGIYKEHIQSTEERHEIHTWEDTWDYGIIETGNPIEKEEQTETIYIHYSEVDNETNPGKRPLVLHEDELSYGYNLRYLISDGELAGIMEKFRSRNYNMSLCSGHYNSSHSHCSGNHGSGQNHKSEISDSVYRLSVVSENNDPNFILDYAELQEGNGVGNWSIAGYLGLSGGKTNELNPNAGFLLYRNKTKDLITLYPGKNDSSTLSLVERLGISSSGYVPTTKRIASEGNGAFTDTMHVAFREADNYDRTLGWKWYCNYTGNVEGSDTWDASFVIGKSISDLNKSYTFDDNIETRYELGKSGTGAIKPAEQRASDFNNVFYNNPFVSVQQDGAIKFYPYTKMVYNEKDNENRKPVYVTSSNLSTIAAFTKVESGVWKNGQQDSDTVNGVNPLPNVKLESSQWSTHYNSLEFLSDIGATDKKSVLPGGAIFDVSMNHTNTSKWHGEAGDTPTTSTKLGYRVWQTCIDDSLVGLLAPDSTAPTVAEAKQKVAELDNSIKQQIPNYGLVQTITKGAVAYKGYLGKYILNTDYAPVVNGGKWNGKQLSNDNKYYLKLIGTDGSKEFNSSITNFDVLKGGIVKQLLYTISSDADGNVYVYRDGTQIGKIGPESSVASLYAQNIDIKQLDDSTKAVSNYISSIDRNQGSNRSGKHWYNEGFDGISVLYSYLSYDIGFGNSIIDSPGTNGNGTATRTAVLDPQLTGSLLNVSDTFNFNRNTQNEKIRSSIILTGQVSGSGVVKPDGKMGTLQLKNGSTIEIKLGDMETFAYSKLFYIPNATVADLN